MPTRIVSHRSLAGAFADRGGRPFAPLPGGLEASGPEAEDQAFMTAYLGDALRAIEDAETLPGVMVAPGHQYASLLQTYLAEHPDGLVLTSRTPPPGGGSRSSTTTAISSAGRGACSNGGARSSPSRGSHRPIRPTERRRDQGQAIFVVGDWGTGLYGAPVIARTIAAEQGFDLLIHLGDVYYSGTPDEVKENFKAFWPKDAGRAQPRPELQPRDVLGRRRPLQGHDAVVRPGRDVLVGADRRLAVRRHWTAPTRTTSSCTTRTSGSRA